MLTALWLIVFFFFKQKTAYEMRISDWSSDVCSSDLCALVAAKIANASFFRTGFIAVRLGLPGFILPFLFVVHPEILGIGSGFLYTAFISAKIGRASCRERVCQYV